MAEKISRLSPLAQRVVQAAACLGAGFKLTILVKVLHQSFQELAAPLNEAMDAGLIQANNDDYKYIALLAQEPDTNQTTLEAIAFRFVHDRIQQAAYGMIAAADKEALHFAIGSCLWELDPQLAAANELFLVANQLYLARALAQGTPLQAALPELFFMAGRKSKDAAAYAQAVQFFRAALSQMAQDPFAQNFLLAFELKLNLAQALSVLNQIEEPEALYRHLLTKARDRHEKAKVYSALHFLMYSYNRFHDSIEICTQALLLFGIRVPAKVQPWQLVPDLLRLRALAQHADPETVFHWPDSHDQDYHWIVQFYYHLSSPCFMLGDENKMVFANVKSALLLFKTKALTPVCSLGLNQRSLAFPLAKLALRIAETRFEDRFIRGMVQFLYYNYLSHWNEHQLATKELWSTSFQNCVQSGNLLYAGYGVNRICGQSFYAGVPLPLIIEEHDRYQSFLQTAKTGDQDLNALMFRQSFAALAGQTDNPLDWSGNGFDEAKVVGVFEEHQYVSGLTIYYILKTWGLLLLDQLPEALNYAKKAKATLKSLFGMREQADFTFLYAMILARLWNRFSPWQRQVNRPIVNALLRRLKNWAKDCPENFNHPYSSEHRR